MKSQSLFFDGKLPLPFSQEKISELLKKMKLEGNEEIRKMIIEHNLRYVVYIARRFSNTSCDMEELISIGTIGLIKSIDTYDIDKGIKFATYSNRCIENEILMFLRSRKKYSGDISIEEQVAVDKEGNEAKVIDTLYDKDVDIVSNYEEKDTNAFIWKIIEGLPKRDKDIICMYYGFLNYPVMTQDEIAKVLGLDNSYISKIIKKNLRILRVKLEKNDIFGVVQSSDYMQQIRKK